MKGLLNRCGAYRQSICLLVAGALGDAESGEVMAHLAGCAGCRKYYDEMRAVVAPLANWERGFAQIEPEPTAQRRWAKAIHAAGASECNLATANSFQKWWSEWILPHRRAWGGMALLWLAMGATHFGLPGDSRVKMTAHVAPTTAMVQTIQEQRRLLAELIPPSHLEPAEPPRRLPEPRSERQTNWKIC